MILNPCRASLLPPSSIPRARHPTDRLENDLLNAQQQQPFYPDNEYILGECHSNLEFNKERESTKTLKARGEMLPKPDAARMEAIADSERC